MTLVYLASILAVLFVLAFVTKRRFGVLALVVAVSYMVYQLWAIELGDLVAGVAIPGVDLPVSVVVGLLALCVPSVVVLFLGGPTYHTKRGRLVGALLYVVAVAVFGLVLLTGSSEGELLTGVLVEQFLQYQNYLVTAVVAAAIVDIVLTRTAHGGGEAHKAKH